MANTIKFGDGHWATKKSSILAFNDENANFKPLPFVTSRASTATTVNKAGLLETVASGVPRVDYLNNPKGAYLLEPSSTNTFSNSEPTTNEGISDGVTYEDFEWGNGFTNCIRFTAGGATKYRYGGLSVAFEEFTVSAFVIMDDLSEPINSSNNTTGDLRLVIGNVTTGTVNESVYYGNNVWRVSTTGPSGGSTNRNGVVSYNTQSGKGFRVTGLQIESGSIASSYIPTSGSAQTRLAETASQTVPYSIINSSEGVLYFEGSTNDSNTSAKSIQLTDGGPQNSVKIYFYGTSINAACYTGGVNQFYANNQFTIGSNYKIAVKFKENDFALWINGIEEAVDSSGIVGVQNLFNNISFYGFYGKAKDLRVYTTILTDAELTTLTTI